MEEQKYNDLKLGERGAIISIIAYICLSIMKLAIGYISDSAALKADGLNNTTDIIASIAVLIGLRLAQRPPDKDHGYGHWKSETIASMVASFIMFAVGVQVLIDAVASMLKGGKESPDIIAGYVGVLSAIAMYFVYRYNKKLAMKINSKAVMAASKDNISDAWVSIGTAIGIFGSQLNMPWLDPLTAIIVGLLICKTAWDIFSQASHELSDGFDENKIHLYKDVITNVDGVKGIKEIKGRNYGNNEVIDVVILVNSTLDIKEAHDIATHVEKVMMKDHGVYDVHVHVEPN
ncbi:cation diffusion facilitator family transporter [Peribacillus frigoritolerans]|uniref:cation diffusion facilitator family transporter n=1 Tax=Peribacillus TaxID=2675229 RepID=UPI001070E9E0|nr:cation diffusion facilitator family transporter [Peribacillus frigoritolerans]MEC0299305.1 cation diffusion facilitator family transporter [Peribacillus castrilensis]MCK2005046.1 cation diffusion facilitator family transporter [Peribacillus frigoritolerans]MDF1998144.1 cation diffusion facilitator family transporter [Peribacillus frigoritolerans]MDM5305837.1 cation diffusion facilitator family transporter [Peribacillus frigoritolerans]MEE3951782.1 cation diffusion facilitator family transpo